MNDDGYCDIMLVFKIKVKAIMKMAQRHVGL